MPRAFERCILGFISKGVVVNAAGTGSWAVYVRIFKMMPFKLGLDKEKAKRNYSHDTWSSKNALIARPVRLVL